MRVTDTVARNWLLLVVVMLGAALFWYGSIDYMGEFAHVDLAQYRRMAQAAPSLDYTVPAPFVYRILPSWLVGITPLPDADAFRVWTIVIMLVVVLLLYRFLVWHGAEQKTALILSVLFIANPYICGLTLFNYFQLCDAMTFLFVLLMMEYIEKDKPFLFTIVLALGAITREANLLMLPVALFYVLYSPQHGKRSRIIHVLASAVPALCLFAGVRLLMQPENSDWSLSGALGGYIHKALSPEVWVRLFCNTFVPLALLPFVFWRTSKEFFAEHKHWIIFFVLVFISTFFGKDTERLLAPAFGVVFLLLARLIDKHRLLDNKALLLFLAVTVVFTAMNHLVARVSFLGKASYYAGSILLEVALVGMALYGVRKGRSRIGRSQESY